MKNQFKANRVYKIAFAIVLYLLLTFVSNTNGIAQDTITKPYKNAVVIDILPIYYDFFDYRKQIRAFIEYKRNFNTDCFASFALDAGVFDDYTFSKYYDFFNPSFYYLEDVITISGFHIFPSYNYVFVRSKQRKHNRQIYAGGILDINLYRKKILSYNSQTSESSSVAYSQFRAGSGISAGADYFFGKHFFGEVRTSVFVKAFHSVSNNNVVVVKPLNAQWTSSNMNFWWVSNLKLGYAF